MEETITNTEISTLLEELSVSINNVWVLIAAILVMFMQPGFAMVESGFTRKKNTANILMKNLMDFSFGALIFWIVGYSIMYGESMLGGIIGKPYLFFNSEGIGDYADKTDILFQTVFAATAATIVSGAMAERTKFHAYLIFTVVITLIIYPIAGHWKWGGGWLDELGFMDFAGSTL
ncbi:MAG: ammonium transporter, partial [Bacteroidota bacterium]